MQLDRLLSPWLENIKRVKTIDFIGYSKEHGSYVWGDFAVQHGKVIALNDEDFFDLDKFVKIASFTTGQILGKKIKS